MCSEPIGTVDVDAARPRGLDAAPVDPIDLLPVDEVVITTLVDNVYDALLTSDTTVGRAPFRAGIARAPQFESRTTTVGLMAEHGFSALVSIRRGATVTTLLFDAGLSPDAVAINADRLGADLSGVQGIVLSHGHFDHTGGLAGLAGRKGVRSLPMVVHPGIWARRRMAVPGKEPDELPTLSKGALEREGFAVIERRQPSLLVDGCVLVTGEIDRTTDFEHGMPATHEAWDNSAWRPDRAVLDDQALVIRLRDRGLVVLTGCGHAGAVNIVRHAQRLTGVTELHALLGGLHLSGPAFEPIVGPTTDALVRLAPTLLVPGHCTGWRAQHALAAALPDSWVPNSSGSSYRLAA